MTKKYFSVFIANTGHIRGYVRIRIGSYSPVLQSHDRQHLTRHKVDRVSLTQYVVRDRDVYIYVEGTGQLDQNIRDNENSGIFAT